MKLEVTRNVIGDLWPVCQSGDASVDSRVLVDTFLNEDAAFARALQESAALPAMLPRVRLSPDAERRLLDDARSRAQMKLLVVGGTIAVGGILVLGLLAVAALFLLSPPR